MNKIPICPYCGNKSIKTTGKVVYPHMRSLHHLVYYQCSPCEAYVGAHKDTGEAYGVLANKELRLIRSAAHRAFDPIWKLKHLNRSNAYRWLTSSMKLTTNECHIGKFNIKQCEDVITLCNNFLNAKL